MTYFFHELDGRVWEIDESEQPDPSILVCAVCHEPLTADDLAEDDPELPIVAHDDCARRRNEQISY